MRSATESLKVIMREYRQLVALEAKESTISRNFNPGSGSPGEKDQKPRGTRGSLREKQDRTLDSIATLSTARVRLAKAEQMGAELKPNPEWEAIKAGALKEVDASPVEVAFIFGYATDKAVRALRIRNGRDQHTGRIPRADQRPLTRRHL